MAATPGPKQYPPNFPVRWIQTDDPNQQPQPGIALCLSGGGYRAMLFHLGALWRLNELGYLPKLDRISSVSGGSITAAVLAMNWSRLALDPQTGVAANFEQAVVKPIRELAGKTIDVPAILVGMLCLGLCGSRTALFYRRYLFGPTTLQDLPAQPRFVINATNLQSGALWRFSRPFMADWRVGLVNQPKVRLADAVAASSAFPPFLSPFIMRLRPADFAPNSGTGLQMPPFTNRVLLTDGGVYDNLGLETAWKDYQTILVSDACAQSKPVDRPPLDWLLHLYRVLMVINEQVGNLRKRQVISSFVGGERDGTYWGIGSHADDFQLPDALPCPSNVTAGLAGFETRLRKVDELTQERLINWGYAINDIAMRRHVVPGLPAPKDFPYPNSGIG